MEDEFVKKYTVEDITEGSIWVPLDKTVHKHNRTAHAKIIVIEVLESISIDIRYNFIYGIDTLDDYGEDTYKKGDMIECTHDINNFLKWFVPMSHHRRILETYLESMKKEF